MVKLDLSFQECASAGDFDEHRRLAQVDLASTQRREAFYRVCPVISVVDEPEGLRPMAIDNCFFRKQELLDSAGWAREFRDQVLNLEGQFECLFS